MVREWVGLKRMLGLGLRVGLGVELLVVELRGVRG